MSQVLRLILMLLMLTSLSACAEALRQHSCQQQAQNRPDAAQRQAECSHPKPRQPASERQQDDG